MTSPRIPVSIGELVDKITILEIKAARLSGEKRGHAQRELQLLQIELAATAAVIDPALQQELREVNQALWRIEDDIRDHERRQDFGASFIDLARSVYVSNDRRAAIKRTLNERHGSEIVEVKGYQPYA
ncbi:MAG: DUF6165 family protein [Prochlorococcaceae cyanobacterium]